MMRAVAVASVEAAHAALREGVQHDDPFALIVLDQLTPDV